MQVDAILVRHGHAWDRKTPQGRPAKRWGALHAQRLRGARLADPASQAAYQAALEAERWASESYEGLVERAREAASSSAPAPAVDAVQWLKGVGFVCALAFCAEVGDFSPAVTLGPGHILGATRMTVPLAAPRVDHKA